MDEGRKLKQILGKNLKEHVVLRDYTTMKVGGVADYFYIAKTVEEIIQAVMAAKKLKIPYEILGGGSNVIVSDFGFGGLIILNRSSNLAVLLDKAQIIVDSGVSLSRLITEAANHSLAGLEPLFGIPGTVGGAIYGNAGAYGLEISQLVKNITVLSSQGKIARYSAKWLEPEYRSTKLKTLKKERQNVPIILSARLQLFPNKKEEILRKLAYYKKLKEEKQPCGQCSAGSIFKNPQFQKDKRSIKQQKEMSAGYILEKIGAKRMRIGDAQVSKKHANFIINKNKARALDIRALIDELRDKVREKRGIVLEEEIEYIGQW